MLAALNEALQAIFQSLTKRASELYNLGRYSTALMRSSKGFSGIREPTNAESWYQEPLNSPLSG